MADKIDRRRAVADLVEHGRCVMAIEARALEVAADRLDARFADAVHLLDSCGGRVLVSGVGKSGLVGRKIASTLSCMGSPAFFLHPNDALHGDLGAAVKGDVLLAISNSGRSSDLLKVLASLKERGIPAIAMVGDLSSPLAAVADVCLDASVSEEACPVGASPSASTTVALALGDALAFAVAVLRDQGQASFRLRHPEGFLRNLWVRVDEVMVRGDEIPKVPPEMLIADAITEISKKGMGMTTVVDGRRLVGIITDGDIRRGLERTADLRSAPARDQMSASPVTVGPESLATEALALMRARRITSLPVIDREGRLVGALHLHGLEKRLLSG